VRGQIERMKKTKGKIVHCRKTLREKLAGPSDQTSLEKKKKTSGKAGHGRGDKKVPETDLSKKKKKKQKKTKKGQYDGQKSKDKKCRKEGGGDPESPR